MQVRDENTKKLSLFNLYSVLTNFNFTLGQSRLYVMIVNGLELFIELPGSLDVFDTGINNLGTKKPNY
jgi:hypothetical protein